MKKSGYYSILHIYFIFFIVSFSVIIFVTVFSFSIISINTSTGSVERSNYPKEFTENFGDQIIFTDIIHFPMNISKITMYLNGLCLLLDLCMDSGQQKS